MKRFLSFMMITTMVIALLTSCNGAKDNNKGDNNDKEKKTVEIWAEPEYKDFFEAIIPKFEKEFNAEVKYVEKKMLDSIDGIGLDGPAGIGPDVIAIPHDRIGNLALEGHISPLKVTKDDMDKNFIKTAVSAVSYDGAVYAMPFSIESTFLIYNKDLIKNGPKSFEELETLAKDPKFANGADGSFAFLAKFTDFYMTYGIFGGFGSYVFGKDNEDPKKIGLNNEGAVEAAEYVGKWYKEYFPAGMKDDTSAYDIMMSNFLDGKTGAIINGPWALQDIKNANINFGVAMLPDLPGGKKPVPFSGTQGWAVTSYAKDPTLAESFVTFVTNEENSIEMADKTSKVPPHQGYVGAEKTGQDTVIKTILDQYAMSTPMPKIVQMSEVWAPMAKALGIIATEQQSAKAALDEAVAIMKQQIEAVHGSN